MTTPDPKDAAVQDAVNKATEVIRKRWPLYGLIADDANLMRSLVDTLWSGGAAWQREQDANLRRAVDISNENFARQVDEIARLKEKLDLLDKRAQLDVGYRNAEIARLKAESVDVVPRSRYDVCNADWIEAQAKLKEVQEAAHVEIARLKVELSRAQEIAAERLLTLRKRSTHVEVLTGALDTLGAEGVGPMSQFARDALAKAKEVK